MQVGKTSRSGKKNSELALGGSKQKLPLGFATTSIGELLQQYTAPYESLREIASAHL